MKSGQAIPVFLLGLLAACASAVSVRPADLSDDGASLSGDRLIVVVRHAEKVDDSRDPELSAAGEARAARLAELLADAGIERVFSTDYIRTRETALPTAAAAGLEVETYDPGDIPGLARTLLSAPQRAILVVGHSNTTPALVEALTGEPVSRVPLTEYDRIYRVRVGLDGSSRVTLDRY